jgi:hypothetical protein
MYTPHPEESDSVTFTQLCIVSFMKLLPLCGVTSSSWVLCFQSARLIILMALLLRGPAWSSPIASGVRPAPDRSQRRFLTWRVTCIRKITRGAANSIPAPYSEAPRYQPLSGACLSCQKIFVDFPYPCRQKPRLCLKVDLYTEWL